MRPFASKPRLLDPTEWRNLGRNQPGIHTDHAILKSLGHTVDPAEIKDIAVLETIKDSVTVYRRD